MTNYLIDEGNEAIAVVCACVHVCVHACVCMHACVRACVRSCVACKVCAGTHKNSVRGNYDNVSIQGRRVRP